MAMERAENMEHAVSIKLYLDSHFNPRDTVPNSPADMLKPLLADYTDGYQWAWILHDEDMLSDGSGELCKSHIHIALRKVTGEFSVSLLSRKYHIARNDIRRVDHWDGYLVYLLHADKESMANPCKHLYPDSRLETNFDYVPNLTKAYKGLTSDNEFAIVMDIIDYLCNNMATYYQALKHFQAMGVNYSIIRKNWNLITSVVSECKYKNYGRISKNDY